MINKMFWKKVSKKWIMEAESEEINPIFDLPTLSVDIVDEEVEELNDIVKSIIENN